MTYEDNKILARGLPVKCETSASYVGRTLPNGTEIAERTDVTIPPFYSAWRCSATGWTLVYHAFGPPPNFTLESMLRRWVFRAVVYRSIGSKGFVGYGDADPSNVSTVVRGAE